MEIAEKEYLEMKEQIRQLQLKVEGINTKPKDLRSSLKETPISFVSNAKGGEPIFDYFSTVSSNDAWSFFLKLAKMVHEPSSKFYMRPVSEYGSRKPYITSYFSDKRIKKITDLNEQQLQLSICMLDEMIPIYNKYFKMLHQKVLYSENGDGNYKEVTVFNAEQKETEGVQ